MDTTVTSPLIIYHATLRSSARKHPLRCSEKQAWPCSWPHAADAERWGCNERWQPSKQMLLEQLYVAYIQELMGGAGVDLEAAVSCTNEWMLSTMESHVLPGSWSETMRRRSSRTVTLFPKPPFFLSSCGRFTLKANRIRLSTIHLVWCRKQFSVKLSPSEIDIMPSVSRCLQISSS